MKRNNLLKRAWEIYKELEGDHLAKLKMALQEAWRELRSMIHFVLRQKGKGYLLAQAKKIKETEKALLIEVEAFRFKSNFGFKFWVPKSQIKNGIIPEWIIAKTEVENNLYII